MNLKACAAEIEHILRVTGCVLLVDEGNRDSLQIGCVADNATIYYMSEQDPANFHISKVLSQIQTCLSRYGAKLGHQIENGKKVPVVQKGTA